MIMAGSSNDGLGNDNVQDFRMMGTCSDDEVRSKGKGNIEKMKREVGK